jgi:hypothetical protein
MKLIKYWNNIFYFSCNHFYHFFTAKNMQPTKNHTASKQQFLLFQFFLLILIIPNIQRRIEDYSGRTLVCSFTIFSGFRNGLQLDGLHIKNSCKKVITRTDDLSLTHPFFGWNDSSVSS